MNANGEYQYKEVKALCQEETDIASFSQNFDNCAITGSIRHICSAPRTGYSPNFKAVLLSSRIEWLEEACDIPLDSHVQCCLCFNTCCKVFRRLNFGISNGKSLRSCGRPILLVLMVLTAVISPLLTLSVDGKFNFGRVNFCKPIKGLPSSRECNDMPLSEPRKATLELPDSELCELNEVECLDSELDVLRLPSLVLERSDSMLPPLLDVAMLSVEE
uniref:Uncharacterized protein n=1 Tax=Glossina brevipalpis TaxID=37001 RepID=A0A1A9WZD3_9MUSC